MSSRHCIWEKMIWSSSSIIFQCEFNCKGDYVIQTLYLKKYDMVIIRHRLSMRIWLQGWLCHLDTVFENIWYGHHQASFFGVNLAVTVIMSSRDIIVHFIKFKTRFLQLFSEILAMWIFQKKMWLNTLSSCISFNSSSICMILFLNLNFKSSWRCP